MSEHAESSREVASGRWQRLYLAAILETDPAKLRDLVRAAESAVVERIGQLSRDPDGAPQERWAIEQAATSLQVLRKEFD